MMMMMSIKMSKVFCVGFSFLHVVGYFGWSALTLIMLVNHSLFSDYYEYVQGFLYGLGMLCIRPGEFSTQYPSVPFAMGVFQFMTAVYLFWGVLERNSWIITTWQILNLITALVSVVLTVNSLALFVPSNGDYSMHWLGSLVALFLFLLGNSSLNVMLGILKENIAASFDVTADGNEESRLESAPLPMGKKKLVAVAGGDRNSSSTTSKRRSYSDEMESVTTMVALWKIGYSIGVSVSSFYTLTRCFSFQLHALGQTSPSVRELMVFTFVTLVVNVLRVPCGIALRSANYMDCSHRLRIWILSELLYGLVDYCLILFLATTSTTWDIFVLIFYLYFTMGSVVVPVAVVNYRISNIDGCSKFRSQITLV